MMIMMNINSNKTKTIMNMVVIKGHITIIICRN